MDLVLDGQGYMYIKILSIQKVVTYNGLVDLKSGFKNVQERIDELSLKLDSGQLNMQTNRALDMAISENQNDSSSLDMFDTGVIIASAFIIFNVFNIMMKEMISEIGLMRVVGMSKNQSLAMFILKNAVVLFVGSLIGFLVDIYLQK
ncbi:FtsX-like permease family protein [Paraclostridium bifermentans]|nr:FtsX-like permease family protein [Paraclostridium bifermentans]